MGRSLVDDVLQSPDCDHFIPICVWVVRVAHPSADTIPSVAESLTVFFFTVPFIVVHLSTLATVQYQLLERARLDVFHNSLIDFTYRYHSML